MENKKKYHQYLRINKFPNMELGEGLVICTGLVLFTLALVSERALIPNTVMFRILVNSLMFGSLSVI